MSQSAILPYVPENIRVHLGEPKSNAADVTVAFPDYIKNVASSEIYPTWPENSLRANIYVIVTFALNRIYTEWYPSQGYTFDITNSTQFDQAFVYGRTIFGNISDLVDELFNDYITRGNNIEPIYALYCDGIKVSCNGLSQWGTVALANDGYTPYQILQYYYGSDISLQTDTDVRVNMPSYPGYSVKIGMIGNDVLNIQTRLNRISQNYPAIPAIDREDSSFGIATETAVKAYQQIFSLPVTGIVNKQTWYSIAFIYSSVKRLGDINSEGIQLGDVLRPYPTVLKLGDSGQEVAIVQFLLAVIGAFYPTIPQIAVDSYFGVETEIAVKALQKDYELTQDGIVGRATWAVMTSVYSDIIDVVPRSSQAGALLYEGTFLREGDSGPYVTLLQEYLTRISKAYPAIPEVPVTGYYGPLTAKSVAAYQSFFGYTPDGLVSPYLWSMIVRTYENLK